MLGKLILILVQLVIGWFASNALMSLIKFGDLRLYIYAVVAAIVVFLIGVLGSMVLRGVGQPGSATLTMALIFALIAAVLWSFGPQILSSVPWNNIRADVAVLVGAVLGYAIKR